ncbi:MAG: aminoacyl-tRNA deacylase [Betaproteobacteria bacterium]|nr:aminoacyl-tRNA deacylase [Betaproteobacteria bacterium]
MARSAHVSETSATQFLRKHGIAFTEYVFEYVEHGGTRASAAALGVDEHVVVKTLIMEDEKKQPLIVLMHGDRTVSTKNLARQAGRKSIEPCQPEVAQRHSGYQIGGTSPFGTRKPMHVYVERTILNSDRIYINGGRRGYLLGIDPQVLPQILTVTPVNVALAD